MGGRHSTSEGGGGEEGGGTLNRLLRSARESLRFARGGMEGWMGVAISEDTLMWIWVATSSSL